MLQSNFIESVNTLPENYIHNSSSYDSENAIDGVGEEQ
jgi:hypothetical protein